MIFTYCSFIFNILRLHVIKKCVNCIPWMHHADYAFSLSYTKCYVMEVGDLMILIEIILDSSDYLVEVQETHPACGWWRQRLLRYTIFNGARTFVWNEGLNFCVTRTAMFANDVDQWKLSESCPADAKFVSACFFSQGLFELVVKSLRFQVPPPLPLELSSNSRLLVSEASVDVDVLVYQSLYLCVATQRNISVNKQLSIHIPRWLRHVVRISDNDLPRRTLFAEPKVVSTWLGDRIWSP